MKDERKPEHSGNVKAKEFAPWKDADIIATTRRVVARIRRDGLK